MTILHDLTMKILERIQSLPRLLLCVLRSIAEAMMMALYVLTMKILTSP